jgi:hypothetical protein
MATVACPYCYNRIHQSRLAFQCRGRGVPGNPTRCTRARDDERLRHTGVGAPMLPVFTVSSRNPLAARNPLGADTAPCPHCKGPTSARACPVCHTPLSATFADSKSPLIGMVGGKGAGKTVYTAVLHHELRTEVRRRFNADIRLVGGEQGGTGSARQWLEANEEQLFEDGKLFEGTAEALGGKRAPVVIEWRQPRRRFGMESYDTTVLSFYDTAGEDVTNWDKARDQEYLGVSDGLVLLLDPWQLPGAAERIDVPRSKITGAAPPLEVLGSITDMLRLAHNVRAGKKIPVPLAVVFAKMDAFYRVLGPHHPLMRPAKTPTGYDDAAGLDTSEHVRALLHEYGADDIDSLLQHNYKTFRYFAVSALGTAPDYERDVAMGVHPFRVEEPLLWLLERFRVFGGRG